MRKKRNRVVGVSVKRKGRQTIITKTVVKKKTTRRKPKGILGLGILGL